MESSGSLCKSSDACMRTLYTKLKHDDELLCELNFYSFLQKCRVSESEVHHALLSGDQQDQLVIAYNLIMDNKRIADETEKLQIRDFFVASSPPVESFMLVSRP